MALYLESSVENNDCVHSDVIGPTTTWQNTTLALRCVENLLRCSVWYVVLSSNVFAQFKTPLSVAYNTSSSKLYHFENVCFM